MQEISSLTGASKFLKKSPGEKTHKSPYAYTRHSRGGGKNQVYLLGQQMDED